jgi:hypothetical protein
MEPGLLKTHSRIDLAKIEEYHEKILLSIRCITAAVLFFGAWWYCSSKPYITGVRILDFVFLPFFW